MFKLTDPTDLEKAGKSIGNIFAKQADQLQKTFAFHKAVGAQHDGMKASHESMHACCKAAHDSMADDHELKGHMAKAMAHHSQMAVHHGEIAKAAHAHADTMKAEADAMKSMADEWGGTVAPVHKTALTVVPSSGDPTGNVITDMVRETTQNLTRKTLESMDTDPAVQAYMRETIMKMVSDAVAGTLGDKLVPTAISAITPDNPHYRAVTRDGQRPLPAKEATPVPLEFEKVLEQVE